MEKYTYHISLKYQESGPKTNGKTSYTGNKGHSYKIYFMTKAVWRAQVLDGIVHFDKRSEKLSRFKALDISKLLTMSFLYLQNHSVLCELYTPLLTNNPIHHVWAFHISHFCNSSHYPQMLGRPLPGSLMVYWAYLLLQEASLTSPAQTAHFLPDCPFCICFMTIITVHNYFTCH